MIQQSLLSFATGAQATGGAILIACALFLPCLAAAQNVPDPGQTDPDDAAPAAPAPVKQPAPVVAAQPGPTVTIRILDGKTGQPINPSNLMIRVDHKDQLFNEALTLNGADPATAVLPLSAKVLSVEGSYDSSTEIYVNCDADTGKDGGTLKWYSIADIMKTGVVTPNLCFKGKFQNSFKVTAKPGEFVFFVRGRNWRNVLSD